MCLGETPPAAVRVQAYSDNPREAVALELTATDEPGCWRAAADVPAGRLSGDFTLRVIPHHPAVP